MKFIDLGVQRQRIENDLKKRIEKIIQEGKYIMGPEVNELEHVLAEFVGAKKALSCSSGTDALLLALLAKGVGPGDAIFTTPFTFVATAEVISLIGATPVFVDIDRDTYNIDTKDLTHAIAAIKSSNQEDYPIPKNAIKNKLRPAGVIAVDLFGLPADYDKIIKIAHEHNMFVIGDAAQSFGAMYKGKRAGSFGDIACTSFFPAKPLGCYGDGGMCFTDNDDIAAKIASLRSHGTGADKYDNVRIGINGRLDTIQAGILLSKFSIFKNEIELRNSVANRYTELISDLRDYIETPYIPDDCLSVWAQYTLLTNKPGMRDKIQKDLNAKGIPTAIYYPKPLHFQTAFSHLGYPPGSFRVSEACATRVISLPMHPYLSEDQQDFIVEAIKESIQSHASS